MAKSNNSQVTRKAVSERRHPRKLSKAISYHYRISTVEYDLHGAIQRYGIDFIHWLADEIHAGRVNCKQSVDRWAAHTFDNPNADFQALKHEYDGELDEYVELDDEFSIERAVAAARA